MQEFILVEILVEIMQKRFNKENFKKMLFKTSDRYKP